MNDEHPEGEDFRRQLVAQGFRTTLDETDGWPQPVWWMNVATGQFADEETAYGGGSWMRDAG